MSLPKLSVLQPRETIDAPEGISALAWSPSGEKLAVASLAGEIQIASFSPVFSRQLLDGHAMGTFALAWWSETDLVSGGADGAARVWDLPGKTSAALDLEKNRAWVEHLALSPDRNFLAVGAGPQISLWKKPGECVRRLPKLKSTVADLRWHPKGKFLASVANAQVCFWRAGSEKPVNEFHYGSSLLAGAWSPQGDWFVTGCQDASVHLWKTASGEDLHMSGYPRKIKELSFHPGGRWLAVGGSPEITVWDFKTSPAGTTPRQLAAHKDFVTQLAFSPNGKWLASGAEDGLVFIWPAEGVDLPMAGYKMGSPVTQLAWRPDGAEFAAGSEDGRVAVLPVPE
jgi:WD40 repeat protein